MALDPALWQARLDELAREHRVPGASLAVLHDGAVACVATGLLNVEAGVGATPDSVFQIGSITKLYTATLAMQLVEEGATALDEPVVSVLGELRLADAGALRQVTLRHLLSHTSGIEGDHIVDVGRGDDVLERYVESCATLGFSHPVGATMSYCNTGFVIAGRMIERLTGRTWDAALRERLLEPLGLTRSTTLPEEALRFRVAHGHVVEPGRPPRLERTWMLPRSLGPAGLICATAADTLAFARAHLEGGRGPDGARILSEQAVAAMREPQVAAPDRWSFGGHWGLGWMLFDWDGRQVFGHDGGTIGQAAFLRAVPEHGVAIALLTSGGNARDLYDELFRELLAALCDLEMPPRIAPPVQAPHVEVDAFAGRYERAGTRIELEPGEKPALRGRLTPTGLLAELTEPQDLTLLPVTDRLFVARALDEVLWTPAVFYELADGSPYLHMGARATPKIGSVRP